MWIPAGHRVLVLPEAQPERTNGGLFVPEVAKEKRAIENIVGDVVAIGPNAWKAFDDGQPWAKVGDKVSFAKYGGFVLEDPETKIKYRLLNDEDIMCVWKRSDS